MIEDIRPPSAGQILNVWFEDRHIGQIIRKSSAVYDIAFKYSLNWLADAEHFPLSLGMPLATREFEPRITYPWFQNLLPEGQTMKLIASHLGVGEADVFGALENMGKNVQGAIEIRRPEERPSESGQFDPDAHYLEMSESKLAEVLRGLPKRPLLAGADGISLSMDGAQSKLPVARMKNGALALALNGAPTTHIIKPQPELLPHTVENEAFCLRLARVVGLPAPNVSMHRADEINYLLVERYDRMLAEGKVIHRIHQEDFCQITGNLASHKYEWNQQVNAAGPSLVDCIKSLDKTNAPGANKLRFIEYLIFNIACGNVDAHAKNYSLLLLPYGKQRMAPIYDVMSADIYENITRKLAMKVGGENKDRGDRLYGQHWERLANDIGFSAVSVKRLVKRLTESVRAAMPAVIEQCEAEFPSPAYRIITRHIADHCRNLANNLDIEPERGVEDEAIVEGDNGFGIDHIS